MKASVIASLAFAVLANSAWGQTPPPPPAGMKPPPPLGGPEAVNEEPSGPPPPPGGPGGHRPPPPPPPSKAAHFRIQHGDTIIDVKCADDEPMRVCADFTLQLLDKVKP